MTKWFSKHLNLSKVELITVSADASFRRYFRYQDKHSSYILVDAPPATEKNIEFIAYAIEYAEVGLDVPRVIWSDVEQGFLCLTDLGNQTLLPLLSDHSVQWYPKAIELLPLISKVGELADQAYYNAAFFEQELTLFSQWFCSDLLHIDIPTKHQITLKTCFELLIESAISQPQVSVHRDFHSRNLMVRDNTSLSIIDFQDTVTGPLTYDAASLLKDCYFKLPIDERDALLKKSYQQFATIYSLSCSYQQYKKWFDLMGLQRHLKVCGIFSRLHFRDKKSHYLNDLPLVVEYIVETVNEYDELQSLKVLFEEMILPILPDRIMQCLP